MHDVCLPLCPINKDKRGHYWTANNSVNLTNITTEIVMSSIAANV